MILSSSYIGIRILAFSDFASIIVSGNSEGHPLRDSHRMRISLTIQSRGLLFPFLDISSVFFALRRVLPLT